MTNPAGAAVVTTRVGPGTCLLDGVERPRRGFRDVLRSRPLALLAFAAACVVPEALRPPAESAVPVAAETCLPRPIAEAAFEPPICCPRRALDVAIPEIAPPDPGRAPRIDWAPDLADATFQWESPSIGRLRAPHQRREPTLRTFAERRRLAER